MLPAAASSSSPRTTRSATPSASHELCARTGVTVLSQTPAAFLAFMEVALATPLPSLRYVFIGGEQWNVEMLVPWFRRFGDRQPRLVHVYGPTETTVFATMRKPFVFDGATPDSSLGRMLPNRTAYVVDRELRPLPDGAIGELCIGGTGLATGYLGRSKLTAETFVANPFQTEADRRDPAEAPLGRNARIYRSGDLVRRAPDGRLTFIGRNDFQVKVQGHRIELGEIEAAIARFPGIARCVAVVRSAARSNYLAVAYYTARSMVDPQALRGEHLAGILPAYMLPAALVPVERIRSTRAARSIGRPCRTRRPRAPTSSPSRGRSRSARSVT